MNALQYSVINYNTDRDREIAYEAFLAGARAVTDEMRELGWKPTETGSQTVVRLLHEQHGITMDDVRGDSRKPEFVAARTAIAVAMRREGKTTTDIGRVLYRDHATILHYLNKFRDLEYDANLREFCRKLRLA